MHKNINILYINHLLNNRKLININFLETEYQDFTFLQR